MEERLKYGDEGVERDHSEQNESRLYDPAVIISEPNSPRTLHIG